MGGWKALWAELWARPETPPTPLSRYLEANGVAYLALGLLLFAWPAFAFDVVGAIPRGTGDVGFLRVLGMAVAVIGWFYVMGGRTHQSSFGLATFVDRMLVPLFLLVPAVLDEIDLRLVVPLGVVDPLLGLGALWLWRRQAVPPREGGRG